jgi:hypothetical protein
MKYLKLHGEKTVDKLFIGVAEKGGNILNT